MKSVLKVFLFLCLGFSASAQTVGIENISLARSDSKGGIGKITEKFRTTDVPIYFLIRLDSTAPVTIKMNLVAVKVAGLKPETKSVNVSYKTDGTQNQVNFNASPSGVWAAGTYRADIFIDENLNQSLTFEIEKNVNEKNVSQAESKALPAKSFAPRRKTRKN